ncbi:carboxypeptidase-like regulatory domain-containing protein [Niabella hirudinis]|uniref:carboxypeptidase-like regulatory domain-containing protein n=1 Tax=Niabella hirudinis TaxID=1285929 RepID=UPI003EC04F4D
MQQFGSSMRTAVFLLYWAWVVIPTIHAQPLSLSGTVSDSITGQPLAGASVYLANTTFGISTGNNGMFKLANIPNGTYQLVVSFIGYQTIIRTIALYKNTSLVLQLSPQSQEMEEMEEIVVTNKKIKKRIQNRWTRIFFKQVIGTSPFSETCTIQNEEALRFKYNKQERLLTAHIKELLLIDNPALGYHIKYDLQNFTYNDSTSAMSYSGIPVYEKMQGSEAQQKRWRENRQKAYEISLLKFMRAVYQQNFDTTYILFRPTGHVTLFPNNEHLSEHSRFQEPEQNKRFRDIDSLYAIKRNYVTNGVSYVNVSPSPVVITAVSCRTDTATVALNFKGSLIVEQWEHHYNYKDVVYKNSQDRNIWQKELLPVYRKEQYGVVFRVGIFVGFSFPTEFSGISLSEPIAIKANGYYSNANNLKLLGLFAWTEKLGTMLPLDYYPE